MTDKSMYSDVNLPLSSSQIQELQSLGVDPHSFVEFVTQANDLDEIAKALNVSKDKVDKAFKIIGTGV